MDMCTCNSLGTMIHGTLTHETLRLMMLTGGVMHNGMKNDMMIGHGKKNMQALSLQLWRL